MHVEPDEDDFDVDFEVVVVVSLVDVSDVEVAEESEVGSEEGLSSLLGSSAGLLFGLAAGLTSAPPSAELVWSGPQSHFRIAGHFSLGSEIEGRMGSGMMRAPPPPP